MVVRDVNLDIAAGRDLRRPRQERHGQEHAAQDGDGLPPRQAGDVSASWARTSPARHRISIARRRSAYAPQEQTLFQDLTVEENLRLGLRVRQGVLAERSPRSADYFPVISQRLKQRAGTLSGGEQKMLLMVTRALLSAAEADAGRRNLRRAAAVDGAAARRGAARRARRDAASRSCWSSRTSPSRSRSPTATRCSRSARSSTAARRRAREGRSRIAQPLTV